VKPFATGLKNARIIAVAPNGNVSVSRREQGDVLLLKDAIATALPTVNRSSLRIGRECTVLPFIKTSSTS
jgi:hypothetical protein